MILIYGASGSGKSETAENIAVSLAKKYESSLIYIATMENKSDAAKKRIERHRKLREGKGFVTIEEMYDVSAHESKIKEAVVLVECTSNLVANLMFSDEKKSINELSDLIVKQFEKLSKNTLNVVVVTNNIFEEGKSQDKTCDDYMKLLSDVNIKLADISTTVLEVVCNNEIVLKGEKEWR